MTSARPDIGPELRQLAQALLDRLEPAVLAAAAAAAAGESKGEPGLCQQVWCPVCAVAALVNGEQHPLLGLIAEHSVSLLTMIRTMAADPASPGDAMSAHDATTPAADDMPPPTQNGRYHHIPIVVEPADSGAEPAADTATVEP
jgi:hypothetical protein